VEQNNISSNNNKLPTSSNLKEMYLSSAENDIVNHQIGNGSGNILISQKILDERKQLYLKMAGNPPEINTRKNEISHF